MCGIWGFTSINNTFSKAQSEAVIRELFLLSESRGKEAAGMAFHTGTATRILKRAEPASELIRSNRYREFLETCFKSAENQGFAAIGHSRLVTNGSSMRPENNQPVTRESLTMVHNGIIVNCEELWERYAGLSRTSEVDTEIFAALVEKLRNEGEAISSALSQTYAQIRGMASVCGIFSDAHRFAAATNNGSLYYMQDSRHSVTLIASERLILKKLVRRLSFLQGFFSEDSVQQLAAGEFLYLNLQTGELSLNGLNQAGTQPVEIRSPFQIEMDPGEAESSSPPLRKTAFILSEKYKKYEIDVEPIRKIRRCTRCVLPETMPFIEFDEHGVCNYCRTYHPQPLLGKDKLVESANALKRTDGRADSIVSFSGGRDSSYGLHYFKKVLGLNPVAYSYDWGMVTDLARRNQSRMCSQLGVELILVSADIKKKRANIRKNVSAWLKKPDLGMIPLFMAGDKHYFYYANKVSKEYGLKDVLMASNPYEKTLFKSGFCGVRPSILSSGKDGEIEQLPFGSIAKMASYYAGQYLKNPAYVNGSIFDTATATMSYYVIPHHYFRLFNYIQWNEQEVNDVLINEYDWELSPDTDSTWRIGDGTAPFYNYIYYLVAGFTENDTLRSNQIREGMLSRAEALQLVERDNRPRFESLQWYFDAIQLDMFEVLEVVRKMPRLYQE